MIIVTVVIIVTQVIEVTIKTQQYNIFLKSLNDVLVCRVWLSLTSCKYLCLLVCNSFSSNPSWQVSDSKKTELTSSRPPHAGCRFQDIGNSLGYFISGRWSLFWRHRPSEEFKKILDWCHGSLKTLILPVCVPELWKLFCYIGYIVSLIDCRAILDSCDPWDMSSEW